MSTSFACSEQLWCFPLHQLLFSVEFGLWYILSLHFLHSAVQLIVVIELDVFGLFCSLGQGTGHGAPYCSLGYVARDENCLCWCFALVFTRV